jgi:hypothetical protein
LFTIWIGVVDEQRAMNSLAMKQAYPVSTPARFADSRPQWTLVNIPRNPAAARTTTIGGPMSWIEHTSGQH